VRYDQAFMYAYSMREKTHAHRNYTDNVPQEVKKRRLQEVVDTFYSVLPDKNREEIGSRQLVLVDGKSRRSDKELCGRTDNNKRVVFPDVPVPAEYGDKSLVQPQKGDYVVVDVHSSTGIALLGSPVARTTLQNFARLVPPNGDVWKVFDVAPSPPRYFPTDSAGVSQPSPL